MSSGHNEDAVPVNSLNSHGYLLKTCTNLTSQLAARMRKGVTRPHPNWNSFRQSQLLGEGEAVFLRVEPLGRLCMLQGSTLYTGARGQH